MSTLMDWESLGMNKPRMRRWGVISGPISPSQESDHFAPVKGAVCYDPALKPRAEHYYCVSRRDGLHCVWCDRLMVGES